MFYNFQKQQVMKNQVFNVKKVGLMFIINMIIKKHMTTWVLIYQPYIFYKDHIKQEL